MVATADLSRSGFINGDISTVMAENSFDLGRKLLLLNDIEYAFVIISK